MSDLGILYSLLFSLKTFYTTPGQKLDVVATEIHLVQAAASLLADFNPLLQEDRRTISQSNVLSKDELCRLAADLQCLCRCIEAVKPLVWQGDARNPESGIWNLRQFEAAAQDFEQAFHNYNWSDMQASLLRLVPKIENVRVRDVLMPRVAGQHATPGPLVAEATFAKILHLVLYKKNFTYKGVGAREQYMLGAEAGRTPLYEVLAKWENTLDRGNSSDPAEIHALEDLSIALAACQLSQNGSGFLTNGRQIPPKSSQGLAVSTLYHDINMLLCALNLTQPMRSKNPIHRQSGVKWLKHPQALLQLRTCIQDFLEFWTKSLEEHRCVRTSDYKRLEQLKGQADKIFAGFCEFYGGRTKKS